MDLLLVSPVSFSEIVNGKMLTAILIVPLQASLWLILLFLLGYLFADSPFNLVTRLSSGAAGAGALVYCGLYSLLSVPCMFI